MTVYQPEGALLLTQENQNAMKSFAALQEAFQSQRILEARALVCDNAHNLTVDLGCMPGIIPREEGALGIREGTVKDIAMISRVNKPVCFVITGFEKGPAGEVTARLSRRQVQEQCVREYLSTLVPGDIIEGRITHLESFGAFVDIGCGMPSLIPIDAISISRITHPSDRFYPGQAIKAVVRSVENNRITLSHKELLGSWEQNAALFHSGETVAGIVRSSESYGVFVELTPNLAGLAEPQENVVPGQQASVYIKSMIPEKMKVKLILVDCFEAVYRPSPLRYFLSEGRLESWRYSPECSPKVIESRFEEE